MNRCDRLFWLRWCGIVAVIVVSLTTWTLLPRVAQQRPTVVQREADPVEAGCARSSVDSTNIVGKV